MYAIYRVDGGRSINDCVRFAETIQDAEDTARDMAEDRAADLEYYSEANYEYDICIMISKVTPVKTFYKKAEIKEESGFTILKS